ncbi:MAG: uncharacterized membrane protein YheB (UPF0754 family), partial [Myxococcota bacterium]
SGAIGYITNVLAVRMMFYPLKFVGIPPYLGWQGIVPANAIGLAKRGLSLITERLLKIDEVLAGSDPEQFLGPVEDRLKAQTREMLTTQAEARMAPMWGALGDSVKEQVHGMAWTEVSGMAKNVVSQIMAKSSEILNLQAIVTRAVTKKPEILVRMFLEIGRKEFGFIKNSGWWFGLAFGLVQLAVWVIFPKWWVLPLFGFLVGYATNWVALKLVFEPQEPKKVGPFTIQGLFHRRQKEVAQEFARLTTEDVFNDANLFDELQTPQARAQILAIVEAEADALVERYKSHPMAMGMMTPELVESVRGEVLASVTAELFQEGGVLSGITAQSEKIREMLHTRMMDLDPAGFESVLRPAFQQDEWKLILAGAVLGGVAGTLQLVFLFGQSLGG